jgi:hypothetical protein
VQSDRSWVSYVVATTALKRLHVGRSGVAESDHWVDARGSSRWKVSGGKSHKDQEQENHSEGCWICRSGAVEQRGDERRDRHGRDSSGDDSDARKAYGLRDYATLDLALGCAESHADADLLGALGDGVGDDTVNAERGKEKSQARESSDEVEQEASRGRGMIYQKLERFEVGGGLAWVDGAEGREYGRLKCLGRQGGSND